MQMLTISTRYNMVLCSVVYHVWLSWCAQLSAYYMSVCVVNHMLRVTHSSVCLMLFLSLSQPLSSLCSVLMCLVPGGCMTRRVAVQQAIRAASAFNCHINKTSYFERKHYFYQDLPLGYQVNTLRLFF